MPETGNVISPRQASRVLGVSESSLKRWCDQGLLTISRTAGGHRLLPVSEVLRFARERHHPLHNPELLGLPVAGPLSNLAIRRAVPLLTDALLAGEEPAARHIVSDLYLAHHPLSLILDEVVAAAFHQIGHKWECHQADVYQERRGCEIARRILSDLRRLQSPPNQQTVAIGGTLEGDRYDLPTLMAELVLLNKGWQATSLGAGLPVTSLIHALQKERPALFWLSVSFIPDTLAFLENFAQLSAACEAIGAHLVVGGRVLTQALREKMRYSTYCDTMQHLEAFANALAPKSGAKSNEAASPSKTG